MEFPAQLFFILLVSGLILIGAEIYVPGGIVGALGGLTLVGAVVTGFVAFPGYGVYIAGGVVLLVVIAFVLWLKVFPRTRMGQRLTVSQDLSSSKAGDPALASLLGRKGVAVSELRPAGFAVIEGRRTDVVTRGEMIEKNEEVEVIQVAGNRIVVARVRSPEGAAREV